MANMASLQNLWQPASELKDRAASKFSPLSAPGLKSLFLKGLERGTITEFNGRRSSGRTSASLHVLAQSTKRGEVCAVIDLNDSFHPASAGSAGVALDRVVWIRCAGNAEHALRAADLLLHAGGFGVVLLDLCEASPRVLNRIPLSYWYRFRRSIEHTPTILLICADTPQAKSCSLNRVELKSRSFRWSGQTPFLLLRGIEVNAARKLGSFPAEPLFIQAVA